MNGNDITMEKLDLMFLEAVKAALKNESVDWKDEIEAQEWMNLLQMADRHHILPMIYQAVYSCPAAQMIDQGIFALYKQRTVQAVMLQTMKTSEFLSLYQRLNDNDIFPVVVKGIVCRMLYPNPDFRISGDEDILVRPQQFERFHAIMIESGMECTDSAIDDMTQAYEIPYGKKGSPIYIEAHKYLFPPDSDAYGELNSYFDKIEERTIDIQVDNISVRTMDYTDHIFYLICHAFKHLLHSGVGIRQVCDIIVMANEHGSEIDWGRVLEQCRGIHADLFAVAVFRIGETYLTFDPVKARYPREWSNIEVDEMPLLIDMLTGGVYGAVDKERQHSSTVTLNAVVAQKQGKKAKANVLRSVFPSVKDLRRKYTYLQKRPYLLPVAWVQRIFKYNQELSSGNDYSASSSLKIGEQRIEMLKQYGILENK